MLDIARIDPSNRSTEDTQLGLEVSMRKPDTFNKESVVTQCLHLLLHLSRLSQIYTRISPSKSRSMPTGGEKQGSTE